MKNCPTCNIELTHEYGPSATHGATKVSFKGDTVSRFVACYKCTEMWTEVYTFSSYTLLPDGDPEMNDGI